MNENKYNNSCQSSNKTYTENYKYQNQILGIDTYLEPTDGVVLLKDEEIEEKQDSNNDETYLNSQYCQFPDEDIQVTTK